MLFAKLSRKTNFIIMVLACLASLTMMVYNLGFSISELGKQLIFVGIMILLLIGSAFGTALLIRYIIAMRNRD